jgi:hypothetical protein
VKGEPEGDRMWSNYFIHMYENKIKY